MLDAKTARLGMLLGALSSTRSFAGLVLVAVAVGCGRSPTKVRVYNPAADAHADVANALAQSHTDHKRTLLIFGANWCVECLVLDRHLHERAAQAIVATSFHLVDIDIGEGDDARDGSGYKNLDISRRFGVPTDLGVPVLAVLDAEGRVVYTGDVPYTNFGGWSPEGGPSADDVVAFLQRWSPH